LKRSFTQEGFLKILEHFIRSRVYLYIFFRKLCLVFGIFEKDFKYLKNIFYDKKINIIDIGASDGISVKFFLNNLNVKKIYCYEPHLLYQRQLQKLKKFRNYINKIKVFNYGISTRKSKKKVYYPIYNFLKFNFSLLSYTFYSKKDLIDQVNLDFKKELCIRSTYFYLNKLRIINKKIDFIKIDTNGYEQIIVTSLIPQIKKDQPVLVIENNNNNYLKIFNILKNNYKKYYIKNNKIYTHSNQDCTNIFYIPKKFI